MYIVIAKKFNGAAVSVAALSLEDARSKAVDAMSAPDVASVTIQPV